MDTRAELEAIAAPPPGVAMAAGTPDVVGAIVPEAGLNPMITPWAGGGPGCSSILCLRRFQLLSTRRSTPPDALMTSPTGPGRVAIQSAWGHHHDPERMVINSSGATERYW